MVPGCSVIEKGWAWLFMWLPVRPTVRMICDQCQNFDEAAAFLLMNLLIVLSATLSAGPIESLLPGNRDGSRRVLIQLAPVPDLPTAPHSLVLSRSLSTCSLRRWCKVVTATGPLSAGGTKLRPLLTTTRC